MAHVEVQLRSVSSSEECSVDGSYAAMAKQVPHRLQQVLITWIFLTASATLLLDFLSLQHKLRQEPPLDYFSEMGHWFGVVSCIHWLLGCILAAHGHASSSSATRLGHLGCYSRLLASVIFNLHPITATMADPTLGAALWWSNATGITFFHVGNLISCYDHWKSPPPGADRKQGWAFHGNLPITASWIFQAATWFLVASNYMACSFDGKFGWAPLVPLSDWKVYTCQILGALLLLLGSIVCGLWCDAFRNWTHGA